MLMAGQSARMNISRASPGTRLRPRGHASAERRPILNLPHGYMPRVIAGSKTIEVARVRIIEAGRQALAE
jgi:hypothetical protein